MSVIYRVIAIQGVIYQNQTGFQGFGRPWAQMEARI